MQSDEDRVQRTLRRVVALIQHRAPGVEQASRNGRVGDLVTQIIGHSAVCVDALKVRPDLARQEERCDVEVLVVRGCKLSAPRLCLGKRRSVQRSQVLRRRALKRMLYYGPVAHRGTPPGKTAVLISREPPLRLIIRAKRPGTSSSPARPVMYSVHLNRPLVTRPNAVRHVAGVW